MTLPSIAIIGRPNVGKSTLVNRLCQSNDAIVFDKPGVTRDRTYQNASWGGREFQVVDTGGLVFEDDSEFLPEIRTQVFLALEEASLALFVVDGNQYFNRPGPRLLESAEILFEIFNFNEKKVKIFENSWIRLEQ